MIVRLVIVCLFEVTALSIDRVACNVLPHITISHFSILRYLHASQFRNEYKKEISTLCSSSIFSKSTQGSDGTVNTKHLYIQQHHYKNHSTQLSIKLASNKSIFSPPPEQLHFPTQLTTMSDSTRLEPDILFSIRKTQLPIQLTPKGISVPDSLEVLRIHRPCFTLQDERTCPDST